MYGCESWNIKKAESEREVAQLCPTLCNSMYCSLPGSSVHGIFQERILESVAISFSRGSSEPRARTQVSHNAGRCFAIWATREAQRKLSAEELMLLNCGVGDFQSPLDWKEIQPVNPKGNQPWIFIGRTDAETSILWPPDAKNWLIGKDPDAGNDRRWLIEGDNRGWHGWMALPTQWTWVWVSSRSWWWTGKPGVLQSLGSQRVGLDEQLNWTHTHTHTHICF